VIIDVEGRRKFSGTIGQFRGKKAICITRIAEPPDPASISIRAI
jgi:flagellar motor switch protein FliM